MSEDTRRWKIEKSYPQTIESAGFEVQETIERFHQKNDIFRRSWWDDTVRTEKTDLLLMLFTVNR